MRKKQDLPAQRTDADVIIKIDGYDDIFSDFDPRDYSERSLSFDFIEEVKRATQEKHYTTLFLKFILPKRLQHKSEEKIIAQRLHDHFVKHYHLLYHEKKKMIRQGALLTFIGIVLMLITTFILFRYAASSLFATFLIVLFEPAGWFLFWEGLNLSLFETKHLHLGLRFYEKMHTATIEFFGK